MGCCGLFGSKKDKAEKQGDRDCVASGSTPPQAKGSRSQSIPRRGSLNSVLSNNSVYYDADEELEHPSGSLSGSEADDHASLSPLRERNSSLGKDTDGSRSSNPTQANHRPYAGSSFKMAEQVGHSDGIERWQVADATAFMVRGTDYLSTKKKVNSRGSIYRLIGVDCYSFEQKLFHIAEHVQLPKPPKFGEKHALLPEDQKLPPLLVINIQLPLYKAGGLLGGGQTDGKGVSLVYYFALPEGFEMEHVENPAAMGLMQRFIHDGKESNGGSTRDRLKLIARVVNVEEWAKKGPLSSYEHSLLNNYNDKPILTRPQQKFYSGPNYFEMDLDIHSYAWLARKAFSSFIPRLGPVVFENAFVLQGNREEELPEIVMACARVSRIDLYKAQAFPATLRKTKSHRTTVEMDPNQGALPVSTFPDDSFSKSSKDSQNLEKLKHSKEDE